VILLCFFEKEIAMKKVGSWIILAGLVVFIATLFLIGFELNDAREGVANAVGSGLIIITISILLLLLGMLINENGRIGHIDHVVKLGNLYTVLVADSDAGCVIIAEVINPNNKRCVFMSKELESLKKGHKVVFKKNVKGNLTLQAIPTQVEVV